MSARLVSAEYGSPPARAGERFVARRRSRRRRILISLFVLLLLLSTGIIYELNQNAVRISSIQIFGADQSFANFAATAMQGKYLGLIPRDSTFFYPASRIRASIIAAHPDIAAVSLFRNGLSGLSIKVNERVPIAQWCSSDIDCYLFDASGFVYATTSAEQPVNSFILYEPLPEGSEASLTLIGMTLPNADKLPAVFDFARQLDTLGSSVTKIVIRDDEVDDILASGTRITYVLGNEENAFTALISARDTMNLADGSIDYVDLRFGSKVYLKKK